MWCINIITHVTLINYLPTHFVCKEYFYTRILNFNNPQSAWSGAKTRVANVYLESNFVLFYFSPEEFFTAYFNDSQTKEFVTV